VQWWLFRRCHRVFNPAVIAGTCLAIAGLAGTVLFLAAQARNMAAARSDGTVETSQLATTRILLMRSQADENLTLAGRGSTPAYLDDFSEVMHRLVGDATASGLMSQVDATLRLAGASGAADELVTGLEAYARDHRALADLEARGDFTTSDVATAMARTDRAVDTLARNLKTQLADADSRFSAHIDRARTGYGQTYVALAVAALASAVLLGVGIEQRLKEYR